MHPHYADIGHIEDKLIEEMAELTKAICKAKRFGYDNYHPVSKKVNIESILDEIGDVKSRLIEFESFLGSKL